MLEQEPTVQAEPLSWSGKNEETGKKKRLGTLHLQGMQDQLNGDDQSEHESSAIDRVTSARSRYESVGSIHSALSSPRNGNLNRVEVEDPYYSGTFGFGKYPIVFPVTVCKCIGRTNPMRAFCIECCRSKWFEAVVILLILLNSILLATYDPVAEQLGQYSNINRISEMMEWVFQIAFTVEAAIKIIALGLCGKFGYFREGWNWLDFIIVVVGWIPLVYIVLSPDGGKQAASSLTVFRSVRILRPLRTLHMFPSLKNLVKAIFGAAKAIGSVMMLCLAILTIFALVGVTLFNGKLRQHCGYQYKTSGGENGMPKWAIPEDELDRFCSLAPNAYGRACPAGMSCVVTDFNPENGLISFDNMAVALLTVFQIITEEGWSSIMYGIFDTTYKFVGIYFILLVLFGSYFMINLLISALSVNYMQVRQAEKAKAGHEQERESFMDQIVRVAEMKVELVEKFLKLPVDQQVRQMELRLMFTYEENQNGHLIVTKEMYDKYMAKNAQVYPKWKRRYIKKLNFRQRFSTKQHRLHGLFGDDGEGPNSFLAAAGGGRRKLHRRQQSATSNYSRKSAASSHDEEYCEPLDSMHKIYQNFPEDKPLEIEMVDLHHQDDEEEEQQQQKQKQEDKFFATPTPKPSTLERDFSDRMFFDSMEEFHDDEDGHQLEDIGGVIESDGKPSIRISVHNDVGDDSEHQPSSPPSAEQEMSRDNELKKGGKDPIKPWGAMEEASPRRKWVYRNVVNQSWFRILVMCLILVNTIILASEHFEQPTWMFNFLEYSNYMFLALFTLEILLRLYGQGVKYYFSTKVNLFDFFIVAMGYVELFFSGNDIAQVFRLLRVLRFLKLVHYWPTLSNLVLSVDATMKQLLPFLVFFSLFLYIFTISGLHLLGGKLIMPAQIEEGGSRIPNGEIVNATLRNNPTFSCTTAHFDQYLPDGNLYCPIRTNYDTFLWSLVTSFQVVSGEDWNSVMYTVIDQTGNYWFVLYYVFLVVFGTYIVLNFFLAILIDTFLELHVKREEEKKKARLMKALNSSRNLVKSRSGLSNSQDDNTSDMDRANSISMVFSNADGGRGSGGGPTPAVSSSSSSSNQNHYADDSLYSIMEQKVAASSTTYDLTREQILELDAFRTNALFVLKPTNQFRLSMADLVNRSWFDAVILGFILLSCVLLALDNPTQEIIPTNVMYGLNVGITVVFALEATLKIIAYGFVRHKGTYLRNPWNILDFFIVVSSIVDLALPNAAQTGAFQVLRALRALRPLRTIQKFEGLRIVVKSFTLAIVPCLQVLLLCMVFYSIFAICGVTFFNGSLHACYGCVVESAVNGTTTTLGPCIRNYTGDKNCWPYENYGTVCPPESQCIGTGFNADGDLILYEWLNPTYGSLTERSLNAQPYSFDNFWKSFQTLFELSSMEIWMEPMYFVSDIVGVGYNPVRGSNDAASIFFLVFLFTMQFFMLQVFVAVLIDTYFDSSNIERGDAFMSAEQKQWVDYNRRALMRPFKPHRSFHKPKNSIRRVCYDIATHPWFKIGVYVTIMFNTIVLMTNHFDPSPTFAEVYEILDFVFGVIYILEAVLKITGLGPTRYFSNKSNIGDFIIVICVIIGWLMEIFVDNAEGAAAFKAIEALRVLRIFRLLKLIPALKPLLATLLLTLYPIINILALLSLTLFIYAVLGMQLFGKIAPDYEETEFLSMYINFNNFPNAFYTLFVMSTGESWNGVMHELSYYAPGAVLFCISFVVLTQLFLLNLFVAVVLSNFTQQFENSQKRHGIKENIDENSLKHYNRVWNKVHREYLAELTNGIQAALKQGNLSSEELKAVEMRLKTASTSPTFLPATKFPDLVLRLKAPLGFRKRSSKANFNTFHVMRYVRDGHIPVTKDGMIHFHATLRALIDINVLQGKVPGDVEKFLQKKLAAYTRGLTSGSSRNMTQFGGVNVDDEQRENDDGMDMVRILANQELKRMIRLYVLRWRVKQLRKHGASDERIRLFLKAYEEQRRANSLKFEDLQIDRL